MAHMAGQFAVAYALIIPHPALLKLLPVLLTAALLFGLVTGTMAMRIYRHSPATPP
jgi:heptaprenyl diphosphate synthase